MDEVLQAYLALTETYDPEEEEEYSLKRKRRKDDVQ